MTGTEKHDVSQLDIGGLGTGKGFELKAQAVKDRAWPSAQFSDLPGKLPIDTRLTIRHEVKPASAVRVSLNPFSDGGK